jgi:FkbM family methyltransferase
MKLIKSILKNTPIKSIVRNYKWRRNLAQWSLGDDRMLGFYRNFIHPDDIVFDIGANIGNRTKIFFKLGAIVIAVEPQEECIKFLNKIYRKNNKVIIIAKALGKTNEPKEMLISDANTISSLSEEWVRAVQQSGRFAGNEWTKTQLVQTTTLDNLIDEYGSPSFIKIDVEGFEYHVVQGLSRPVNMLSVEFVPEYIDSTFHCIEYLSELGKIGLNLSIGESMEMEFNEWVSPKMMIDTLEKVRNNYKLYGDVYIKFLT